MQLQIGHPFNMSKSMVMTLVNGEFASTVHSPDSWTGWEPLAYV
jgi:hypothetical protein